MGGFHTHGSVTIASSCLIESEGTPDIKKRERGIVKHAPQKSERDMCSWFRSMQLMSDCVQSRYFICSTTMSKPHWARPNSVLRNRTVVYPCHSGRTAWRAHHGCPRQRRTPCKVISSTAAIISCTLVTIHSLPKDPRVYRKHYPRGRAEPRLRYIELRGSSNAIVRAPEAQYRASGVGLLEAELGQPFITKNDA
jgi:hypothetical protein